MSDDALHVQKPSTLDQLFRFSQHEDKTESAQVQWQISAGSLENKKRLYRIYYKTISDGVVQIETEVTVRMDRISELEPFFIHIRDVSKRENLSESFRKTCLRLIITDPWLGYLWASKNL